MADRKDLIYKNVFIDSHTSDKSEDNERNSDQKRIKLENEKENNLKRIFSHVFNSSYQVVLLEGKRFTGKSQFLLDFVAQNLIQNPAAEVLFFDVLGKFKITQLAEVCSYYIPLKHQLDIPVLLKRFRLIRIRSSKNFHKAMNCLESMIMQLKNLSFIVIDSLAFYFFDSFVLQQATCKRMTHNMFIKSHLQFFSKIAEKYQLTILLAVPEHLLETERINYVTDKEEEKRIYNHIQKNIGRPAAGCSSWQQTPEIKTADVFEEEEISDNSTKGLKIYAEVKQIEMSKTIVPDVTMTFKNISSNHYMIHIDKYGDEFDVNFDVTDKGIEFLTCTEN